MDERRGYEEIQAALTGPGQPFEVTKVDVGGIPTLVYCNTPLSLRVILAGSEQWELQAYRPA